MKWVKKNCECGKATLAVSNNKNTEVEMNIMTPLLRKNLNFLREKKLESEFINVLLSLLFEVVKNQPAINFCSVKFR